MIIWTICVLTNCWTRLCCVCTRHIYKHSWPNFPSESNRSRFLKKSTGVGIFIGFPSITFLLFTPFKYILNQTLEMMEWYFNEKFVFCIRMEHSTRHREVMLNRPFVYYILSLKAISSNFFQARDTRTTDIYGLGSYKRKFTQSRECQRTQTWPNQTIKYILLPTFHTKGKSCSRVVCSFA